MKDNAKVSDENNNEGLINGSNNNLSIDNKELIRGDSDLSNSIRYFQNNDLLMQYDELGNNDVDK